VSNSASLFESLLNGIKLVAGGDGARDQKLKGICMLLSGTIDHYDWVGFYLADGRKKELTLGPFVGEPTEHTKIPFGSGICGQAAQTKETFIVQDVSRETNYLSCSPLVKSEIVVPVFKGDKVAAELDIDSHTASPFSDEEREFLEEVCRIVSVLF
jgi:L-methionine (R)-S-oxide reductase